MNYGHQKALKLAPFFRSQSASVLDNHLYAHMLREDIALGIMPIGGRSRRHPAFNIEIDGTNEDIDIAKALIDSFSYDKHRDFSASYCDAIEEIVKSLTWEATSLYEILVTENINSAHHISSKSAYHLPFFTIQPVPRQERKHWKKKILWCRNKHIWTISIPKCLGGPKGFQTMIKKLAKIPPGSMPNFVTHNLQNSDTPSKFDFSEYRKQQILYINRTTSKWNWHRRDFSDDYQCEYYRTYKKAMFKYSQALLREHVACEINKLLGKLGIKCTITINGLTSSPEILSAVDRLYSGETKFTEIYDMIYN